MNTCDHPDVPVRVRIAPSPTGRLHIGNLRCALFNWLYARKHKGKFIIRIEDTDLERSKPEYVDSILAAFEWAGMASDEPIAFQSKRFPLYQKYIERLLEMDKAYWSNPQDEENGKSVVRFRVPRDRQSVAFQDCIRGEVTFELSQIDDFVIARHDGSPLYNFVVVVDDIEMRISHVFRGEDHISNTPRQILLYEAFASKPPRFAHLPFILGASGQPLSKRDAATSVIEYREGGFLPEALWNYLVRLGWSHGDQEIFSRDEMIRLFTIGAVHHAGATFDMAKLKWMNSMYIRAYSPEKLISYIHKIIDPAFEMQCAGWQRSQLEAAVSLFQERAATVIELRDLVCALHGQPVIAELPASVTWDKRTATLLESLEQRLLAAESLDVATAEREMKAVCVDAGVAFPELAKPVRFALTGTLSSPSVSSLLVVLGWEESVERINRLKQRLRESV